MGAVKEFANETNDIMDGCQVGSWSFGFYANHLPFENTWRRSLFRFLRVEILQISHDDSIKRTKCTRRFWAIGKAILQEKTNIFERTFLL